MAALVRSSGTAWAELALLLGFFQTGGEVVVGVSGRRRAGARGAGRPGRPVVAARFADAVGVGAAGIERICAEECQRA